jgi:hypothetical protein
MAQLAVLAVAVSNAVLAWVLAWVIVVMVRAEPSAGGRAGPRMAPKRRRPQGPGRPKAGPWQEVEYSLKMRFRRAELGEGVGRSECGQCAIRGLGHIVVDEVPSVVPHLVVADLVARGTAGGLCNWGGGTCGSNHSGEGCFVGFRRVLEARNHRGSYAGAIGGLY